MLLKSSRIPRAQQKCGKLESNLPFFYSIPFSTCTMIEDVIRLVPHLNLFDERYPGEKVTIQLKNGEEYTLNH